MSTTLTRKVLRVRGYKCLCFLPCVVVLTDSVGTKSSPFDFENYIAFVDVFDFVFHVLTS